MGRDEEHDTRASGEPEPWGERVARSCDESSAFMSAPEVLEPTVAFLAERAEGGPVLEFAIGTGRVALPLRERGWTSPGSSCPRTWCGSCGAGPAATPSR
ncbi:MULTISPECIES: hypothetical protein [unclassified Streptomyces]|uniref:hypothetical protein n=1 Tax=unclassified Streptomyces TaxID=2593676 RepID=UPI00068BC58F|nr:MULTISPECIES: hypothetical protein [unclassified Streptomyces]